MEELLINEVILLLIAISISIKITLIIVYFVIYSNKIEECFRKDYNNSIVFPILYDKIQQNASVCVIKDYYGEHIVVDIPKYNYITKLAEQLIQEDLTHIIKKQFN